MSHQSYSDCYCAISDRLPSLNHIDLPKEFLLHSTSTFSVCRAFQFRLDSQSRLSTVSGVTKQISEAEHLGRAGWGRTTAQGKTLCAHSG
jgi:hypothetical protein